MREMSYQSSEKHSQQPKQFRGGDKKVMKKRLALLLSVAMAFSMFANVAFGATNELTTTEKYEALVQAGIFNGVPGADGKVDPQLNTLTDRAQFAKILALTAGLEQVTDKTSFKDQNYGKHWAKGYIEAVVQAGYMNGVGNDKFDLKGKVTAEQVAKSILSALGVEPVADAPAVEGASKWAYGYIAAAKAAGLDEAVLGGGKWNAPVNRAVLVEVAYAVKAQLSVSVESARAINENTVEVTFSDKEVVKVTLEKALVEGEKTTVEVSHKGQTYKVEVTLQALAAEATVKGLTNVDVKLTRAVDDTKAKIEIKRGTTVLTNKEVKFSDDKTSASITLGNRMLEGDYTLTVSGASDKAVSTTFKVEAEKVAKIELTSDTAPVATDFDSVSIGYKVTNQYGEDMGNRANIDWRSSKGDVFVEGNKLVIKNKIGTATLPKFIIGDKITITGIESTKYQTTLNTTITVGEFSKVDKVEFKELYNADGKELNTDSDFSKFVLLFDAIDQYGNKITKEQLDSSLYVTSSNQSIVDVDTVSNATYGTIANIQVNQGKNLDSYGVALKKPNTSGMKLEGKATINFVSKLNGKSFGFDVEVKKASTVTKFDLQQPADAVAVGDTVKIPYVAYDQFGKEVTDYDAIMSVVTINGGATHKKDPVTKKLVIEYKATTLGTVFLSSWVQGANSPSNIQFQVKEAALPKQVVGVGSAISLGANATHTLNKDNIKIADQHGREMSLKDAVAKGYKLKLKNNNSAIVSVVGADEITLADGSITLKALTKGSANLELSLVEVASGNAVANSAYSFNVNVVDKGAIKEYKLTVADTVANFATDASVTDVTYADKYAVEVKVQGVKADGGLVTLSKDEYTVTPTNSGLKYDKASGKLKAEVAKAAFGDKDVIKSAILVTVDSADAATTLTQEITISKAAREAKSFVIGDKAGIVESVTGNVVTVAAPAANATKDVNVNDLLAVLKIKDQYGVELPAKASELTNVITTMSEGVTASGNVVSGLKSGSSFVVNFYANTLHQAIKVIVE